MKTVNEVSKLTGVSIRTLQYYDNIEDTFFLENIIYNELISRDYEVFVAISSGLSEER